MKGPIPSFLWIAIVALGLIACVHLGLAVQRGSVSLLAAAGCEVVLIVGLVQGRKWALVVSLVFAALGTAFGFGHGLANGLGVLIGNALVVVPLILCRDFFYPEFSRPPANPGSG
ncbi:MAG: hypothetical protein MUC88_01590 [Planctomycetes bacterium]|jgi:hypothetical protein|nr:hypothetical protein [Planctomycetota bacterium]